MRRSPTLRTATLLALVVLAACGIGGDEGPPPESPTTAAATLRSTMEVLFREHAFLLGAVTENAVTGDRAAVEGAGNALEENTLALADRFETAYAERGENGFLAAWRPYTELVGQYATRRARKLSVAQAGRTFAGIAARFGTFASNMSPLNNARVMSNRMSKLIAAMQATVDAQVAKDFVRADSTLRSAGALAAEVGAAFARTFADDLPTLFPGDPRSGSSSFRADITAPLVEHVFLTGLTTENVVANQAGPRDGARKALEAAGTDLAKKLGAVYGVEIERSFQPLWKKQADLIVSYATAAKDAAQRAKVADDLEQYARDAAGFLAGLNPELDMTDLERILGEHGQGMTQAVDAQIAGDPTKAALRLRAAAAQLATLAAELAVATVERFPVRFRPTPVGF